jgi:thymidine kinase
VNGQNIYLEISPRQTGKTTRLVQAATDWINKNLENHAIICTVNNSAKKHVQYLINIYLINNHRIKVITQHESITYLKNLKWFYDEFDHFEKKNLLIIDETGYYVTTPKFIRNEIKSDDLLMNLLKTKNGEYERYERDKTLLDFWEFDKELQLTEEKGIFWESNLEFNNNDPIIQLMRKIGYNI